MWKLLVRILSFSVVLHFPISELEKSTYIEFDVSRPFHFIGSFYFLSWHSNTRTPKFKLMKFHGISPVYIWQVHWTFVAIKNWFYSPVFRLRLWLPAIRQLRLPGRNRKRQGYHRAKSVVWCVVWCSGGQWAIPRHVDYWTLWTQTRTWPVHCSRPLISAAAIVFL